MKIKVDGLDELKSAFKRSPEIVKKEIDDAIRKTLLTIQAKSTPKIPVDTGFLRNAWSTRFGTLSGELENTAKYASFIHDGTNPHWPPMDAIERWANRHGIPPFLVARSISQKGTKGKPFLDDAVRESESDANRFFETALTKITEQLAK